MWSPRAPAGIEKREHGLNNGAKTTDGITTYKRERLRRLKKLGPSKLFTGGEQSRKAMDTLFSVFLGVVILCSRVGSVSAQLPTGKRKITITMFGVLLLFERGKEKFKPYVCRFLFVEVNEFRAGVCDGVEEKLTFALTMSRHTGFKASLELFK